MRSRLMQYCSGPPMQNHSGVDSFWFFVICSHFLGNVASSNRQEFVLSVADKDLVCR